MKIDRVWCGWEVEKKKKGINQPTTQVPLSSDKSSSPQKIGVSNDLGKISLNGGHDKSAKIGFFFFVWIPPTQISRPF